MKKQILIIILSLINTTIFSQIDDSDYIFSPFSSNSFDKDSINKYNEIVWIKSLNGWGNAVYQLPNNNNIIIAGSTGGGSYDDLWYCQTDSIGNILWEKKMGKSNNEFDKANDLIQTKDNGFLMVGITGTKLWVIKTDLSGNVEWEKKYGSQYYYNEGLTVIQQSDESFVIGGYQNCNDPSDNPGPLWILTIDKFGNEVGEITYNKNYSHNSEYFEGAVKKILKTKKGFITTGISDSYLFVNNPMSSKYGTEYNKNWANSVTETNDNGLIFVGGLRDEKQTAFVFKIDSLGNKIWENTYENDNLEYRVACDIIPTYDNNYLIAEIAHTKTNDIKCLRLIKINDAGSVIKDILYPMDNAGASFWGAYRKSEVDITYSNDGGYLIIFGRNLMKIFSPTELITKYVIDNLKEWEKKGKYEKLSDYQNRVNSETREQKISELSNEYIAILGNKMFYNVKNTGVFDYDSESEIFKITFEEFGDVFIHVPIAEAKSFDENFNKLEYASIEFGLSNADKIVLKNLKVKNPSNSKTYKYDIEKQVVFNKIVINNKFQNVVIKTDNSGGNSNTKIVEVDKTPPQIEIILPQIEKERGFKPVNYSTSQITVKGKATDESGVYKVTINGIIANLSQNGDFYAQINLLPGENKITVIASDIKENSTTQTYTIVRYSYELSENTIKTNDKYYALIIGISNYTDPKMQDLNNEPTNDAKELKNILTTYYTFEEENVTLLLNPTNSEIIRKFDELNKIITDNDNLLIFYAGHGYYDTENELGYWLPSNADINYTDNWIYNDVLVANIKKIKSKHTLLISDACFSGSIFRSVNNDITDLSYQKKYALKSRNAITSGTLKTVPNKSIFFDYLSKYLRTNTDKYMSASQLFSHIEIPITRNSPNTPQFGDIQNVGDEGGDFIFILRNK